MESENTTLGSTLFLHNNNNNNTYATYFFRCFQIKCRIQCRSRVCVCVSTPYLFYFWNCKLISVVLSFLPIFCFVFRLWRTSTMMMHAEISRIAEPTRKKEIKKEGKTKERQRCSLSRSSHWIGRCRMLGQKQTRSHRMYYECFCFFFLVCLLLSFFGSFLLYFVCRRQREHSHLNAHMHKFTFADVVSRTKKILKWCVSRRISHKHTHPAKNVRYRARE